jgi:hypothetical protein
VSANRVRADYLQSVAAGLLSVHDVLTAAADPGHRPLLRIRLDQLLRAQAGWGAARSTTNMGRLLMFCGLPADRATIRRLDIGWLLDPRASGQRVIAWLDVTTDVPGLPWRGFPYTPAPTDPTGEIR